MRTSDKNNPKSLSVDQMYADQELETVPNGQNLLKINNLTS